MLQRTVYSFNKDLLIQTQKKQGSWTHVWMRIRFRGINMISSLTTIIHIQMEWTLMSYQYKESCKYQPGKLGKAVDNINVVRTCAMCLRASLKFVHTRDVSISLTQTLGKRCQVALYVAIPCHVVHCHCLLACMLWAPCHLLSSKPKLKSYQFIYFSSKLRHIWLFHAY